MGTVARMEITGQDRFDAVFDKMGAKATQHVVDRVNVGALAVHKDAVESIQRATSGKIYKRGSILHTASPAGAAPNTDTGNLAGRLRVSRAATKAETTAFIGSFANYAASLEYGTKFIEPRPYMRPAFEKNLPAIKKEIIGAIKKGLSEGNT